MPRSLQHLLLVTLEDAEDPRAWSGIPRSLAAALSAVVPSVTVVSGPQFRPRRTPLHGALRAGLRGRPPRWPLWMTEASLRHYAVIVEQAIAQHQPDAVLSISSQCLARVHTATPSYMYNDAPWYTFKQTYAEWDPMPLRARSFARAEAAAARRTRLVFTGSEWSAEEAMRKYALPPHRIVAAHLGANWQPAYSTADLLDFAASRARSVAGGGTLELLFVGKDWERKGGPLAVEIASLLHSQGQPVRLHIVGCRPELPESASSFVSVHGVLDLGDPANRDHLQQLFIASHFVLVPTQAECFGIVFAEAQSFAVPVVSRRIHALPSIVLDREAAADGETGVLLPPAAGAAEYASALAELAAAPDRYQAMAANARQRFLSEFTWDHVAAVIQRNIERTMD